MRDLVRLLIKYWYLALGAILYFVFFSWLMPETLPHFIVEFWGVCIVGVLVWVILEWKGGGIKDAFWLRDKIRHLEPPIRELIGLSCDIMGYTSCLSPELMRDLISREGIGIRRGVADQAFKVFGDIRQQPVITHEAYPHLRNNMHFAHQMLKLWTDKNDPLIRPLFERYPPFASAIKELEYSIGLCINVGFRLENPQEPLNAFMGHLGQSSVEVYKQSLDILEKAGVLSAKMI